MSQILITSEGEYIYFLQLKSLFVALNQTMAINILLSAKSFLNQEKTETLTKILVALSFELSSCYAKNFNLVVLDPINRNSTDRPNAKEFQVDAAYIITIK